MVFDCSKKKAKNSPIVGSSIKETIKPKNKRGRRKRKRIVRKKVERGLNERRRNRDGGKTKKGRGDVVKV